MPGSLQSPNDICTAIRYYTGGVYKPSKEDFSWRNLQKRLDASEYDGFQFAWFMARTEHAETGKRGWDVLQLKNLMCCDKAWDLFITWKANRYNEVRDVVFDQLRRIALLVGTGRPLHSVLLYERGLNAVVRIEQALTARDDEGYDPTDIIHMCGTPAWEKLLGDPEYLQWCSRLNKAVKRKGAVYRAISGT